MKKIIALLLAAALLLSLTACKAKEPEKEAETPAPADAAPAPEADAQPEVDAAPADAEAQPAPPVPPVVSYVTPEELVGSWTLSADNDLEALSAVFPEASSIGGMMEIGMDGLLFWTLGLTGGGGNFTVEDDVLKAELFSDTTGAPEPADITLDRSGDVLKLVMAYKDASIIWEPAN